MPDSAPQLVRFVILTVPRTGSNMLCTLLNSHPEILCHHEIFNEEGVFYALDYRDGRLELGTMSERDRDPLGMLQRVWQHPCGQPALGFKLNNYQCPPVLRAVLADAGVRKIVLRRDNQVKAYVSWLISRKVHQWEVYRGDRLAPRPRVEVDHRGLQDSIAFAATYYDEVYRALRETNQDWLDVTYEKLFDDAERLRILEYLDVSPQLDGLRIDSVKQNPNDLRRSVSNFDELATCLRGTELETQLLDCGM